MPDDRCSARRAAPRWPRDAAGGQQRPGRRPAGRPARHREAQVPVERLRGGPVHRHLRDPELRLQLGLRRAHRLSHHRRLLRRGRVRPDQGQRRAVPADPARRHLPRGHRKARLLQPVDRLQPAPRRDLHRRPARQAVAVLLIAGVGSTKFADQTQADLQRRLRLPRLPRRLGRARSSTCATTSSRSTCSASARTRRTSSSPAA